MRILQMGLREYTKTRPAGPERFREEYSRSFLLAVHHVLFVAVKQLAMRLLAGYDEVALTGALVQELNAVVASPKTHTWDFMLSIHDDPPVDIGVEKGKRRPRVDIQIEKVHLGPRVRFSFEAKRLRLESSNSLADYVGEDGLGCFVSGRYASHAPWAGMLGYVESGPMENWIESIGAKIAQVPALSCDPEEHWGTPEFPFESVPCRRSSHHRSDQIDILIFHSFADLRQAMSRSRRSASEEPQM
jgi:hypothetical protein